MSFVKRLEISLKNISAAVLRAFLAQPPRMPLSPYRRILFIRYDGIGDMILSLPVFKAVRREFPEARIEALCNPQNGYLLEGTGLADDIHYYDKHLFRTLKLIRTLRKQQYELLINLMVRPSFTFGLIARLSAPRAVRIGGDQERYGYFYNRLIALPPKREIHMLKRLFLLSADLFNPESTVPEKPWVRYEGSIQEAAKSLFSGVLESLAVQSTSPRIAAVNLSAGLPRREWPLDRYAEFLHLATEKYHEQLHGWAIFSDPGKPQTARQLARSVGNRKVTVIPAHPDFRVIMELLRLMYVLITPDTSLAHAASAMGTPVLDIMIGENINVWNPVGVPHQIVTSDDPFSLKELPVARVSQGLHDLINSL